MRIDGVTRKCTRGVIRKHRHERPIWGVQTVIHSRGSRLAGIYLDGSCRAAERDDSDGRFTFLSLREWSPVVRLQIIIAYRRAGFAKASARRLP